MIDAAAVRDLLMGGGAFIGCAMTGVGAYRLCAQVGRKITAIPATLERGVEALQALSTVQEAFVRTLQDQTAVLNQVIETKDLVIKSLGQISEVRDGREEISRELRLMSRRFETYSHGEGS